MRKIVVFSILLLITKYSSAQGEVNSLQLSAGKSWHGTGDLNGVAVDVSYEHNLNKRFSFSNGLTTTIHYGKDKGFNGLYPGTSPDARLMRFTTAGTQLSSLLNFAFLSLPDQKVRLSGGAVLRFQSTSYPQVYGYYQNEIYFPEPFYVVYDHGKQNTFAVGYAIGLSYLTKVTMKYSVGIKAQFQNDTNSDAITQVSLIIGRLLPRADAE